MGEAKNKRQRFILEHPVCCFCGGKAPATTIDHVPGRVCFPDKIGPHGFEFPACDRCQGATRLDELAIGFVARTVDFDDTSFREDDLTRLVQGVSNNVPEIMLRSNLTTREKRRAAKDMDLAFRGEAIADASIFKVSVDMHERLIRYARKIALALYYRETGDIVPPDHFITATWSQVANSRHMEAWLSLLKITPNIVRGSRPNFDFGQRFAYRFNVNQEAGLFVVVVQFGSGLTLAMIIVAPDAHSRMSDHGWVQVRQLFA